MWPRLPLEPNLNPQPTTTPLLAHALLSASPQPRTVPHGPLRALCMRVNPVPRLYARPLWRRENRSTSSCIVRSLRAARDPRRGYRGPKMTPQQSLIADCGQRRSSHMVRGPHSSHSSLCLFLGPLNTPPPHPTPAPAVGDGRMCPLSCTAVPCLEHLNLQHDRWQRERAARCARNSSPLMPSLHV